MQVSQFYLVVPGYIFACQTGMVVNVPCMVLREPFLKNMLLHLYLLLSLPDH